MASTVIFEWDAKEHLYEEKGADWYWALGIVATAVIIVSILFNNILLAVLILAAGASLALAAAKRPAVHHFTITDAGVAIDNNLYLFSTTRSFAILEHIDRTIPPTLSLKTNHVFAPHLLIPIVNVDPLAIYEYVSQHVEEGKHHEPSAMDQLIALFRL